MSGIVSRIFLHTKRSCSFYKLYTLCEEQALLLSEIDATAASNRSRIRCICRQHLYWVGWNNPEKVTGLPVSKRPGSGTVVLDRWLSVSTRLRRPSASTPFVWLCDSDSVTCAVRRTRTTYGDRCFAVAGPRVWNSLPTELRQSVSLGQFKRRLKTHLFGLWDHSA